MKINYQDYLDDFYEEEENYRGGKVRKFKDVDLTNLNKNKNKKAIRKKRQQKQKQRQNEEHYNEEEY